MKWGIRYGVQFVVDAPLNGPELSSSDSTSSSPALRAAEPPFEPHSAKTGRSKPRSKFRTGVELNSGPLGIGGNE